MQRITQFLLNCVIYATGAGFAAVVSCCRVWYDSVNIFRQDVRGSWDPVLQTMAKDLERTLGK